MRRALQFLFKIFKFGVTGVLGLSIDFTITAFLKEVIAINAYISSTIGFTVSAFIVFKLHKNWTFTNHDEKLYKQFTHFIIAAIFGCILNIGLTFLFNHILEIDFYASKILAALLVAIFNFWLSSNYIFKTKRFQTDEN